MLLCIVTIIASFGEVYNMVDGEVLFGFITHKHMKSVRRKRKRKPANLDEHSDDESKQSVKFRFDHYITVERWVSGITNFESGSNA